MQGEPNQICEDCKHRDDTGGEWFAFSYQFAAFLCFQCYQRRHKLLRNDATPDFAGATRQGTTSIQGQPIG